MSLTARSQSPIDICSHKRSGTHLLAATIQRNFELPDMTIKAVIHQGKKFIIGDQEWKPGERAAIPWGALWRTHNFFNPSWVTDPEKILYIVRNPVNTLMSYQRLMDPLCEKAPETFIGQPGVRFWFKHAKGYTKHCHWVRYEDLVGERHDEVLGQIAAWFGLQPKYAKFVRVEEHVGWYSAETPRQTLSSEGLVEACKAVVPEGFLGYTKEQLNA